MKIIKNTHGQWQEDESGIDVPDTVLVGFMNSPYFQFTEYTDENYAEAEKLFEIEKARRYLNETDYIVIRRQDEKDLNIPNNYSDKEYKDILKKRENARSVIRNK